MHIQALQLSKPKTSIPDIKLSEHSSYALSHNEQFISFKANKAEKFTKLLAEKDIKANFENHGYLADGIYRVVNIMEQLFGKFSLPRNVKMRDFISNGTYAAYSPNHDTVYINRGRNYYKNPILLSARGAVDHTAEINKSWSA